jgi:phosphatidylglycerol:prolipoprotein diacylglycerol transferase
MFRDAGLASLFSAATAAAGMGILIGRVGACFMIGDDFGIATDVPWGVSFPTGSVAYERFAIAGLIEPSATRTPPLHPLQLYLGANALFIFCVIKVVSRKPEARRWLTVGLFFSMYGINRFVLEYLRHPLAGGRGGQLSSSQVMAILCAIVGLLLLAVDRHTTTHANSPL